jgi:DNA polymerase III delta subunit
VNEHYYVCGEERILVDEVVSLITKAYPVQDWNLSKYSVGLHTDAEIWDGLFSASIDGNEALTVVTGADKLTNMHLLPELIRVKSPKHVVIFVSNEHKIERTPVRQDDGSNKFMLPEHFENFEKKGKIIECIPFTQATAKTAVAWVESKMEAKEGALVQLLNDSNGDLRLVRDVLVKLQWIGEPANIRNVKVLLLGEPSDTLSDALLGLDKSTAMQALAKLPPSDYLQLVGHLDAQMDLAGRVHDMLARRKTVAEIMREVGSQAFLVPAISKVARHYSKDRRLAVRKLLAETDRRLRRGQTEGVMESLVALW